MSTHNRHTIECLRKTGIDAKTATSTVIETTENAGERFHVTAVFFVIDAQSGVIGTPATVSVGVTAAAYVDILPATVLTGLTALNKMLSVQLPATVLDTVAPNTGVRVNVSSAAIGIGATQTFTAYVWGFYA